MLSDEAREALAAAGTPYSGAPPTHVAVKELSDLEQGKALGSGATSQVVLALGPDARIATGAPC